MRAGAGHIESASIIVNALVIVRVFLALGMVVGAASALVVVIWAAVSILKFILGSVGIAVV